MSEEIKITTTENWTRKEAAPLVSSKEIDQMTAGRELDVLIAEKVMGWTNIYTNDYSYNYRGWQPGNGYEDVPHYSKDIAAAWPVLEGILNKFAAQMNKEDDDWRVVFDHGVMGSSGYIEYSASAETAPLAICRAALKMVMGESKR